MIGLNFAYQDEAKDFAEVVSERIRKRKMRTQQQSTTNKNPPSNINDEKDQTTIKNLTSKGNAEKDQKRLSNQESKKANAKAPRPVKNAFSFFKSKSPTKLRISTDDIGGPANFVHVDGVRHTSKGFEKVSDVVDDVVDETEKKVSKFLQVAGLSTKVLEDSARREEIYDFVEKFDVLYEIDEMEKHSKVSKAVEQQKRGAGQKPKPDQNRTQSASFPPDFQKKNPQRKVSDPTRPNSSRYKDPRPPPSSSSYRPPPPIPPTGESLERNNSIIKRSPPPVPGESEFELQKNRKEIQMITNTNVSQKRRSPPPIPLKENKLLSEKTDQSFPGISGHSFQHAEAEPVSLPVKRLPPPIPKKEIQSTQQSPQTVESEENDLPPPRPEKLKESIPKYLKPADDFSAQNSEAEYTNYHNQNRRNVPQVSKKDSSLHKEKSGFSLPKNDIRRPQKENSVTGSEDSEYSNVETKRKPPQIPKIKSSPTVSTSTLETEETYPLLQQQQQHQKQQAQLPIPIPPRNRSPSPVSIKPPKTGLDSLKGNSSPGKHVPSRANALPPKPTPTPKSNGVSNQAVKNEAHFKKPIDEVDNNLVGKPPPPPPPPMIPTPAPPSFINKTSSAPSVLNASPKTNFGKENMLEEIRLKGGLKGAGLKKVEAAEEKPQPDDGGSLASVLQLALRSIQNANVMSDDDDDNDDDDDRQGYDSTDSWD